MAYAKKTTLPAKVLKEEASTVVTPTLALPVTFQQDLGVATIDLGASPSGSGPLHVLDADEKDLFTFSAAKKTAHRLAMNVSKDIRLPTLEEARLMFKQRHLIGSFNRVANGSGDELYWCTNEKGRATLINFVSGYELGTLRSLFKHASLRLVISGKPVEKNTKRPKAGRPITEPKSQMGGRIVDIDIYGRAINMSPRPGTPPPARPQNERYIG